MDLEQFLQNAEALLSRVEALLPPAATAPDWTAPAHRWRRAARGGWLQPVHAPHRIRLSELSGIERQKSELARNTRQFLHGLPANNALLWGARGTGKSSLVKALLNEYGGAGLRLVEVEPHDLVDLPDIVALLADRPERFLIFSDDLSFEAGDPGYKALKSVLDGSVAATPDNVLVYATSNRRHLMPEFMEENRQTRYEGEEVHPAESVEEKVSLSDRFGLWLSFYPFGQDDYLRIVQGWLEQLGISAAPEQWQPEALRWAQSRGRSGRAAWQFARDYAGRLGEANS